ncbi:fimbria/pilus periplasmic chaperone [Citrobacter sp. Awk 2]|uniref:fimbria/pilus periplasmic chaperone n=1 Tax=Citrobacter sp. Awk 2 TaxID=2963959 RepID=UPI0023039556|nr:fimbria/pilus periplasmic chaperone [Citrobacter sp. Awk 2]MDA8502716.1 fimbria/pilus periplasmic chaperone [Citrobacter sp. Awk 2]
MKSKTILHVVLLACFSQLSYANMSVYPMSVDMNEQGEGSVRVISRTNEIQYIKSTVLSVSGRNTPQEKETEINIGDPHAIVVMPPKFALPAGANKMVRLVSMEPVQTETTYRVKFEAVPQPDDEALKDNNVKTQLTLNLIWGVLVSIPPAHPQLKMSLQTAGLIKNDGNQRFKILKTGLCKKGQKEKDCVWQEVNINVYPGSSYTPKNILNYDRIVVQYWNWIDKSKNEKDFAIH